MIAVLKDGEVLAGSVLVHDSARAWHIVNGVRRGRTGLDARANLLCLSACIRVTLDAGRVFDFEGSLLPGVEEYYRTMGGTPAPILRLQRSPNPAYRLLRAGQLLLREQRGHSIHPSTDRRTRTVTGAPTTRSVIRPRHR